MLYLSDLKVPEGVEIPELAHGRNSPVVSVHHARAEEVETPAAEAAAAAGAAACCGGCGACGRCQGCSEAGCRSEGQGREEVTGPRAEGHGPPLGAARSFSETHQWLAQRCRSSSGSATPGPSTGSRGTTRGSGSWTRSRAPRAREFRSHSRYHGEIARVEVEGRELTLLKPQTYMNRSGLSVRSLVDYMKAPLSRSAGRARRARPRRRASRGCKLGGGHGGHNGLRDTITHCGADFWRLRLGIGHPGDRDQVIDYVLQRAAPADEEAIVASLGASFEALAMFVRDGAEKAMKRLAQQGK